MLFYKYNYNNNYSQSSTQHNTWRQRPKKKVSISLCFNYFNAYYFVNCIYTVILKKDILDIHLHHI